MSLGFGKINGFFVQTEDSSDIVKGGTDAHDGSCTQGQQHVYTGEPQPPNSGAGRHC